MADISFQAAKLKPSCRIAQMRAKQILGQGSGDPVNNDLGALGAMHQHRFDPMQVEGPAMSGLQTASIPFMQADSVKGTDGNDRLVRNDLGFHQEMVAGEHGKGDRSNRSLFLFQG